MKQCILSFVSFLASLFGGVSTPLTEVNTWTTQPQSPSVALQRGNTAKMIHLKEEEEEEEEEDRCGSL